MAHFIDALIQTMRLEMSSVSKSRFFSDNKFLTNMQTFYVRYHISLIGLGRTVEAEFVLFGKIGQQITQKPLLSILHAEQPIHEPLHEVVSVAHEKHDIPSKIAAIVTRKYRFVISITEKASYASGLHSRSIELPPTLANSYILPFFLLLPHPCIQQTPKIYI